MLAAEKNFIFSIKTLSLCFFLERFFLFFNLDCQNLAMLGFDNSTFSENEKSFVEINFCFEFFYFRGSLFQLLGTYILEKIGYW